MFRASAICINSGVVVCLPPPLCDGLYSLAFKILLEKLFACGSMQGSVLFVKFCCLLPTLFTVVLYIPSMPGGTAE